MNGSTRKRARLPKEGMTTATQSIQAGCLVEGVQPQRLAVGLALETKSEVGEQGAPGPDS